VVLWATLQFGLKKSSSRVFLWRAYETFPVSFSHVYYGLCFLCYNNNNNNLSFIFFHSFSSLLLQTRVFNMSRCVYCSTASAVIHKSLSKSPIQIPIPKNAVTVNRTSRMRIHVSMVDSSSSDFAKRIERAWLISKVQSLSLCPLVLISF